MSRYSDIIGSVVGGVKKSFSLDGHAHSDLYTAAEQLLVATAASTPAALTMGASTILARLASGGVVAATVAEIQALIGGYAIVTATHDASSYTPQDITYTNLGWTPSAVFLLASVGVTPGCSIGFANASLGACVFNTHISTANSWNSSGSCVGISVLSGYTLGSAAMISNGIRLSWSGAGATGTVSIMGFLIR